MLKPDSEKSYARPLTADRRVRGLRDAWMSQHDEYERFQKDSMCHLVRDITTCDFGLDPAVSMSSDQLKQLFAILNIDSVDFDALPTADPKYEHIGEAELYESIEARRKEKEAKQVEEEEKEEEAREEAGEDPAPAPAPEMVAGRQPQQRSRNMLLHRGRQPGPATLHQLGKYCPIQHRANA